MFVPQNVIEEGKEDKYSVLSLLDEEQNYPYTVIIGNPGSGKSTLAQYKVLTWAENYKIDSLVRELPLLIELRNYIQNRRESACNFLEYCERGSGAIGKLNRQKLHQWLEGGKSSIIFDGLDEVLDNRERENVVKDIIDFQNTYPRTRILITSRPIGYDRQRQRLVNANFRHFRLQDLDEGQIRDFLTRWHQLAFDNPTDGEIKRDRLSKAIDNYPAYRELAGNPLLLTMMAILNRRDVLPRDRNTLYEQASQVLLQHWEGEKYLPANSDLEQIEYQDKQEMLGQVAEHIQNKCGQLSGDLLIGKNDLRSILGNFLADLGFQEPKIRARGIVGPVNDSQLYSLFCRW